MSTLSTVVGSLSELLLSTVSGEVPAAVVTLAVLVTDAAALPATLTFSVMLGAEAPAAISAGAGAGDDLADRRAASSRCPVPLTKLRPAGSVSVTVVVPWVAPVPLLVTAIV